MAANIYDWSLVAANNSNSDGDLTWAEGMAPSAVNNSARVMMQRVKQILVDVGGSIAAAGTANGLTVAASSPFTALADGQIIAFRATASNSGAATLNVNSIGAKAIRKMDATGDVALVANEIRNTGIYVAQYSAALNGAAGAWLLVNPTTVAVIPSSTSTFTGFLTGLTLSNNVSDATNDLDIAVGCARDSTDVYTMVLASALGKRIDAAWAVGGTPGSTLGGMDTGSVADGNTYHVHLIRRPDTGIVDALFSLSATAPTMPANYTQKRRIGSVVYSGTKIQLFTQIGDQFIRVVQAPDYNQTNPGTSAVTVTLASVPAGIIVEAQVTLAMQDATASSSTQGWLSSLTQTDAVPAFPQPLSMTLTNTAGAQSLNAGEFRVVTNTSRQVRWRQASSTADHVTSIATTGWIDTRGRI